MVLQPSKVVRIDAQVDPRQLPAGVVFASTHDAGYGSILAAQDLGLASPLGISYDERGEAFIAALVKGRGLRANAIAGSVQIGARFFTNAWKDYGYSWGECWWREALQNGIDNGARNIRCSVTPVTLPNGGQAYDVVCEDDGTGMTLDILQNKFLTLGETGKEDTAAPGGGEFAGGFGKAKELLLFGWIEWEVYTNNLRATGNGGIYTIDDNAPRRKGTMVRARMSADRFASSYDCRAALQSSHIPGVRIYLDGQLQEVSLLATKRVAELSDGRITIYTRKADAAFQRWAGIVVRLDNGLKMYTRSAPEGVNEYIVVVLHGKSTDLLQANRNSLSREYQDALDRWVNELAKDVRSQLKERSTMERVRYQGRGRFRGVDSSAVKASLESALTNWGSSHGKPITISKKQREELESVIDAIDEQAPVDQSGEEGEQPIAVPPRVGLDFRIPSSVVGAMLEGTQVRGAVSLTNVARLLAWEPDFLIINEIEGFRVPKNFRPQDMSPQLRKLARFWAEVTRLILVRINSEKTFSVGWHFDTSYATGTGYTLASYAKDEGDNFVMLNPFRKGNPDGELLTLASPDDVNDIVARAIHEVTHLEYQISGHDEDFANAMSNLVKRLGNLWPQVSKVRQAVVRRGAKTGAVESLETAGPRKAAGRRAAPESVIEYTSKRRSPEVIDPGTEFTHWKLTRSSSPVPLNEGEFGVGVSAADAVAMLELAAKRNYAAGSRLKALLWDWSAWSPPSLELEIEEVTPL